MRLLLAGGGTGGHLFPAVAIAQRHLELEPDGEVLFVGTERGIEAKVLPELDFPLKTIDIRGFVGRGIGGKLALLPLLFRSLKSSLRIVEEFRPDVTIGVGGYASGPVIVAAKMKKVPVLIHEQNAWPGLTNRLLGRWADRICLSMSDADRAFHHGRTVLTGNPLRAGMENMFPIPEGKPLLLVFGGSRGARAINEAMVKALSLMNGGSARVDVLHQTGEEDFEWVRQEYEKAGWSGECVVPFITDMAGAYARAHLVVCRAGATTIAELTACSRPSILIPYPYAAGDHQTANALALARKGGALLLPQQEMSPQRLASIVGDLLADRQSLLSMSRIAGSCGIRGAVDLVLRECRNIAKDRRKAA